MSKYGSFDKDGKFVITNPETPEPWLHYLIRVGQPGTETFCSGVSYTGGGFDVRGTHENTFVDTKLHLNDEDNMGRYVYLYDKKSDDLFTTTWQPVRKDGQTLKTTFEFGKISFESSYNGVEMKQDMFVPEDFDGWVQDITIKNTSSDTKELAVYPFVPVHMGNALERLLAGDNDGFFGGCSFDKDLQGIVFRRNQGISVSDDPEKINGMLGNVALYYSTLNDSNTPFATDMEGFFGTRFHNQANPKSILDGKLPSKNTPYLRRACGVFQHDITLAPGEEINFAVSLIAGSTADYYLNNKSQLKSFTAKVQDGSWRKDSVAKVLEWWKDVTSQLKIESPDSKLDNGFRWLQYQCEIVYVLNRMKSRYHTGYEYGWGFRDILQDILYTLPYRADKMADVFKHISTQMFSNGKAYHNFFINQPGNKNIEASDDPLWFANAIVKYVKETGNFSFLDEVTDYAEVREGEGPCSGSILEHAIRGIDSVWNDCSDRNLPYLKDCDWNDDLNILRENGEPNRNMESVMVAQQLFFALNQMAELLEITGKHPELISEYKNRAQLVKEGIEKHAMDKEGYFKRVLSLKPGVEDIGTSDCKEAKIYLEPQAFGINCGVIDGKEADKVLDAVQKYLDSDFGSMLCYPVYTDLADRDILPENSWNIEKEPPAMKENGGIFMHLNAWLVQSYAMVGRGKDAVAQYLKNLPENMSSDQDRYKSEPYVYPEYVRGKDIEAHGRGGHTWLTGTAPTMHMALTEYVYGVRAEYKGLEIDPCVDPSWKEFTMERNFRGDRYEIKFSNPKGVERGVASIEVDGKAVEGNIIPALGDGKTHQVKVVMG